MKVLVSPVARADVRRVSQPEAIRILRNISRFAKTGTGDLKTLVGPHSGKFRLRIGNYRVIFRMLPEETILVLRVLHRGDAY